MEKEKDYENMHKNKMESVENDEPSISEVV